MSDLERWQRKRQAAVDAGHLYRAGDMDAVWDWALGARPGTDDEATATAALGRLALDDAIAESDELAGAES
jgi:hypothetical protein